MKKNVGTIDKVLRAVIGIAIIGAGIVYNNWLGLIGVVLVLTALFSFCPLYKICGCNSCKDGTCETKEG